MGEAAEDELYRAEVYDSLPCPKCDGRRRYRPNPLAPYRDCEACCDTDDED